MGYSADFYKLEKDGSLKYMFCVSGSDACQYFEDVESWEDIDEAFMERKADGDTWTSDKWANPWKTSKISDDVVVFEEVSRKWFEIWKPRTSINVWLKTHHDEDGTIKNDETKMWFSSVEERYKNNNSNFNDEEEFVFTDLRLFELPIMK
jgi:hypothetical protein